VTWVHALVKDIMAADLAAGEPGSIVLGRNIVDQARHVEGVVAVRDRLTYPLATEAS